MGVTAHLVSMGVCPRERTKGVGSGMTLAMIVLAKERGLDDRLRACSRK